MSKAISILRQVAEDRTDPKSAVCANILADCARRDRQRVKMSLSPIFGEALTSKNACTTTYSAVRS